MSWTISAFISSALMMSRRVLKATKPSAIPFKENTQYRIVSILKHAESRGYFIFTWGSSTFMCVCLSCNCVYGRVYVCVCVCVCA